MAAVVSSHPSDMYHRQSFPSTTLTSFYTTPFIPNNFYKQNLQKLQKQTYKTRTPTPTTTIEHIDSNIQQIRSRREPRIHRQVIVLPKPDPIYRQVRHRLPTPERQVIQRTVIQKANGDVVVQHQRHRKSKRSHSHSDTGTSNTQQANMA